jgi:hypothetical protein
MPQIIELGKLRFYFAGDYNSATTYEVNDIVKYGGNVYVYTSNVSASGNAPTDTLYWQLMVEGLKFEAAYDNATAYEVGDGVSHSGRVYICVADTTGNTPPNDTYWARLADGIQWWLAGTNYALNDVVAYSGNTYKCIIAHTGDTSFEADLTNAKWEKFNGGLDYLGSWTTGRSYKVDDIVKSGVYTYICVVDHTSSAAVQTDVLASKWAVFAVDALSILPEPSATTIGQSWGIAANGLDYELISATGSDSVYYVAPHGTDTTNSGRSLATPFLTIKYATTQCGTNSTIFVKNGTYTEQLPITVPDTVAIIGDNQRTVIVQPASGLSDDGVTNNNEAEMFRMSNGSVLRNLTLKGMTGWVPAAAPNAGSLASSTPKGIGICLNPDSPVTTKSPYIMECSAIGSGMIGAYVNGASHSTGNQSMLFHAYTVISDNGVGFWVANGAKAEIVSCFTYYCYFGYGSDHGAQIRALNGNNSYGTWGAVSEGYDQSETPLTALVTGERLHLRNIQGSWNKGDLVISPTGQATITNMQTSAGYAYVKNVVGSFTSGQNVFKEAASINTSWYMLSENSTDVFYFYSNDIIGADNSRPTFTVERGKTYRFTLNSGEWGHQLAFKSAGVPYTDGVSYGTNPAPGITGHVITFTVPFDAPNELTYYDSGANGDGDAAGNTITVVNTTDYAVVDTNAVQDQRGFLVVVDSLQAEPIPGTSVSFAGDPVSYVIQSISGNWVNTVSEIGLVLSQEKSTGVADGTSTTIREGFSQIRLTGHDFLSIGTGGVATTNYPNIPTQAAAQGNETSELFPGRVYYVSTDQDGNFRVGEYFKIDQATGTATLNANAFNLAGLSELRLGSIGAQLGEAINEFSSDVSLSGNSNVAVPTEAAVKTYVDTQFSNAAQTDIPFYSDTVAVSETLSNRMRFSMETLTIPNGVTYTIGTNGFHHIMPLGASLVMFNA